MKVTYLNHYLSDHDVANFARQSFSKLAENFTEQQNNNLIRYLARGMQSGDWDKLLLSMTNCTSTEEAKRMASYLRSIPTHWIPFSHPHISLRVQAPVPIARQLFKHKIGLVESEESRRYVSTPPTLFIPQSFRQVAENVKQGSAGDHPSSSSWLKDYQAHCEAGIQTYNNMIAAGICPEQARFVLPQGVEVQWAWTGSLYAFANMYIQRSDAHAQKEVQEVAAMIQDIIAPLYPVSWSALTAGGY